MVGREILKYVGIYVTCEQFWPTLIDEFLYGYGGELEKVQEAHNHKMMQDHQQRLSNH
jgi:hypothetical protein